MDTEIRVSTESRPWRRKFSRRSSRDSNPRPFNHESGALTTELSPPPWWWFCKLLSYSLREGVVGGGGGDFFVLLVCVCVPNACVHACERLYVYTLCVLERVYGGGREWGGGGLQSDTQPKCIGHVTNFCGTV